MVLLMCFGENEVDRWEQQETRHRAASSNVEVRQS